ncbi:MAG: hypothetical protein C5B57_09575, partial [Blastocatellia bacterium]
NAKKHRFRILQALAVALAVGVALILLVRSPYSRASNTRPGDQGITFTRVGRSGPVFTIAVPRLKARDDQQLMQIAERLSAEEVQAGASGQISVMIWPDDVQVPKEPPTTEFDASMKTQIAGIFINPKLNVKHLIRFRDGATISERDFGKPTR